ncbi:MAG: cobalamin-dependent protein [Thermodesulfobacteriota bacterium]|nr:cobalamin-dependent protein [Thermodesulfobacteriota bacterium]
MTVERGEETVVHDLAAVVKVHNQTALHELLDDVSTSGMTAPEVRRALIGGLEEVRKNLMSNDASIPDFLLSLDTVTEGLGRLSRFPGYDRDSVEETTVVIGVVEGDPHDLGKNVIAGIYRAYGYRVLDLGREVSREAFVKAVVREGAEVLALSAMMSTTMVVMHDIIGEIRIKSPGTSVIVGGAPLNDVLARSYGADGYAESALTVLEETDKLIAGS